MQLNPASFPQKISRNIVFIDARVEEYQKLVNGVQAGVETFVLHPEVDGVEQITQFLAQHEKFNSIHIISHGAPGTLYLGNTELSINTIERYAWEIHTWFNSAFDFPNNTLLLYGCNVAATDLGIQFLEKLHQFTSAAIYASSTRIGNTTLSGNWDLDVCYGNTYSLPNLVLQPEVLKTYSGVFATGTDGKYTYYDSKESNDKGVVTFDNIISIGTSLAVAQDQKTAIALPFTFNFYGNSFSQINIGENGGIIFGDSTARVSSNNSNFTAATPANSIFPFWDDLTGGQIHYKSERDRFIVQWSNFAHQDLDGSSITFQLVLHKDSNNIDFIYQDAIFGDSEIDNGASASIGLKSTDSFVRYSFEQASLDGVTSIRFLAEPRLNTNTLTISEGATVTLSSSNLSATDVDNTNLSNITYIVSNLQNGQFLLNGTSVNQFTQQDVNDSKVTFVHNGDEAAPSYNIQVTDAYNITDAQLANITFTNVNDNPTLTNFVASTTFNENSLNAATAIVDNNISLDDVDSPNFNGGNLVINYNNGGGVEDQLGFFSGSLIAVNGKDISFNGAVIGSIDSISDGTNGKNLVTNFTSSNATLVAVKALIENLTYQNTSHTPNFSRTVSIAVNDGDGGSNNPVTTIINVIAENDRPVNNVPSAQSTDEDQPLIFTGSNLISISDADAGSNVVQVALSANNGTLSLSNISGVSFLNGDGADDTSMEVTGTLADINQALDGMIFKPTANYNGATSISITTQDLGNTGSGSNLIAGSTINMTVNAVNDAPITTVPGQTQSIKEDTNLIFGNTNGNAISISDLDVNEGSGQVRVTLSVTQGVLSLAQTTGLTFSAENGSAIASMTFTGNISDINNALNGLTYRGNQDTNGTDTLTIVTEDLGNTGIGGNLIDTKTVNISIAPVNDAPVDTLPANQSVREDKSLIFSNTNGNAIQISDVDVIQSNSEVEVTLSVTNGVLTLSDTTNIRFAPNQFNGSTSLTFRGQLASVNAALDGLSYRGNANFHGSDTLQVRTSDLGNTGEPGALVDSGTLAISVLALNDAPINIVPDAQNVREDMGLIFNRSNGNAISISDVDVSEGSDEVEVTLAVKQGVLTLQQITGLTFVNGSNGDAIIAFKGSLVDINSALESLTYRSNQGFQGEDILSITTNDLGNYGSDGAQLDMDRVVINVTPKPNNAPFIANGIASQFALEDAPFSFTIADDAFNDIDPDDNLTYTVTTSDGSTLPSWISFDSITRSFSGTPTNGDVGSVDIQVTATDTKGMSASNNFNVVVLNTNDSPIGSIVNQTVTAYTPFKFQFAANAFKDDDGDPLTFSARLADGRPLPAWLTFDAATRTFRGFPTVDKTGILNIQVTANDGQGGVGSNTFALNVQLPTNNVTRTIKGSAASNTLRGGSTNDLINGYAGNDKLYGDRGNDNLNGDQGDDFLQGDSGSDILNGGIGNDRLYGDAGNDTLIGEEGHDRLYGSTGDDILDGGIGNDTLYGNAGKDILLGGSGSDRLRGGSQDDLLYGGADDDRLYGDTGNDTLYGEGGRDRLRGGRGDDLLHGGAGNDILYGDTGNDTLIGSVGDDLLWGGKGKDKFVLSIGQGKDTIQDFTDREDQLLLSPGLTYEQLTIGQSGRNTSISITSTGELLATLVDVKASLMTAADFSTL